MAEINVEKIGIALAVIQIFLFERNAKNVRRPNRKDREISLTMTTVEATNVPAIGLVNVVTLTLHSERNAKSAVSQSHRKKVMRKATLINRNGSHTFQKNWAITN